MSLIFNELEPGRNYVSDWNDKTKTFNGGSWIDYRRFFTSVDFDLIDSKNRKISYEFCINLWPDGSHTVNSHVLRNGQWFGAFPKQKNTKFSTFEQAVQFCEELFAKRLKQYTKNKNFKKL